MKNKDKNKKIQVSFNCNILALVCYSTFDDINPIQGNAEKISNLSRKTKECDKFNEKKIPKILTKTKRQKKHLINIQVTQVDDDDDHTGTENT